MRFLPISRSIACLAVGVVLTPGAARADDVRQIATAMKWAQKAAGEGCNFAASARRSERARSHLYQIRYRHPGQDQDSPDTVFPLYELLCARRSYDATFIYLTKQGGAFRILSFAEPKLDYDYTDESFSSLRSPPKVAGYTAASTLSDSAFDPKTNSISMNAKWRKEGDAWSSGTWQFNDGQFVLKRYDVDPTYEGSLDGNGGKAPAYRESYQVFPDIEHNQ